MNSHEKKQFIDNQINSLRKVYDFYRQLKEIDNSLGKLYPITIVKDDFFFVFDFNEINENYEFKLEYLTPMHIENGILASFSLEFYNMKPSAIVSEEVFDSIEGYVFIFHEFVHCYQWETYEVEIRETLEIEKKSKENNNFMWEITYPFSYDDSTFIEKTIELGNYFNLNNYYGVLNYHKEIKKYLMKNDYEYMIWQEWKEGFARYVENLIRDKLGIKRNTNDLQVPFERVCFYHIGSRYIELLIEKDKSLKCDLNKLYFKMYDLM